MPTKEHTAPVRTRGGAEVPSQPTQASPSTLKAFYQHQELKLWQAELDGDTGFVDDLLCAVCNIDGDSDLAPVAADGGGEGYIYFRVQAADYQPCASIGWVPQPGDLLTVDHATRSKAKLRAGRVAVAVSDYLLTLVELRTVEDEPSVDGLAAFDLRSGERLSAEPVVLLGMVTSCSRSVAQPAEVPSEPITALSLTGSVDMLKAVARRSFDRVGELLEREEAAGRINAAIWSGYTAAMSESPAFAEEFAGMWGSFVATNESTEVNLRPLAAEFAARMFWAGSLSALDNMREFEKAGAE